MVPLMMVVLLMAPPHAGHETERPPGALECFPADTIADSRDAFTNGSGQDVLIIIRAYRDKNGADPGLLYVRDRNGVPVVGSRTRIQKQTAHVHAYDVAPGSTLVADPQRPGYMSIQLCIGS